MHGPVKTLSLIVMIIFVFTKTQQCHSNQFNIVRDAEIENIIEGYARPIFNSAGLTAEFLVADDKPFPAVCDLCLLLFLAPFLWF